MIIGIDLGTTNSLVAVWRDGRSELLPNALGHVLTPSVVGLDDHDQVIVGLPARERLLTHPHLTTAVFKRSMGTQRTVQLGTREFRPEELSSFVLRALKADAEAALGQSVVEAVITVPAYFSDAQRKATRIAGELAGLKVERLLNEPTAAALAYGLHRLDQESKFLVFDLGGGTFDVSILELFEGVMEVRASAGDNFLGGEDFVDALIDGFCAAANLGQRSELQRKVPALYQALRDAAERAKRELSSNDTATMRVAWQGREHVWTVDHEQFARMSEALLVRLRVPVERALRDARIKSRELDEVILAGGATRMPLVRRLVARMFGRLPNTHLNPDEVVALGAAVQAGLKMRDAALDEVVMTDICPYTLGIEIVDEYSLGHFEDGVFAPIIERNTVIPASRSKRFYTTADFQRGIAVSIFQGESRLVKDNVFLGRVEVAVPPKKRGEESIDVRFTYDINGLLEVDVTVLSSGAQRQLVIEQNPGVLKPEEIKSRLATLAALKVHPREQTENVAALARADRIYQQSLGQVREHVGHMISAFRAVLDAQDPGACADARAQLLSHLDEIEGETYL